MKRILKVLSDANDIYIFISLEHMTQKRDGEHFSHDFNANICCLLLQACMTLYMKLIDVFEISIENNESGLIMKIY